MVDDQLVELQSQFAFQEDLLRELNEVVTKQQAQIDVLRQELSLCNDRVTELEAALRESSGETSGNEPPPHY